MPLDFAFELDPNQARVWDLKLARLPQAVRQMLKAEIEQGLGDALAWMVENKLTGGTTPTRLARRSGNLIDSIKTRTTVTGDVIRGELYQDQRYRSRTYAKIHEYGATIRAKRAPYLMIPIREGDRIVSWRKKKEVTIPARPYFEPTALEWFPKIMARVEKGLAATIRAQAETGEALVVGT